MRESDRREYPFHTSLALLFAAAVAACGASATDSGDAGSKQGSDYPKTSISIPLDPGCPNKAFVDTKPDIDEVQPLCQVIVKAPCKTPGAGACHADGYTETSLNECIDPANGLSLNPMSPQPQLVPDNGRPCWYLFYDDEACLNTFAYQRITVLEKTGLVSADGSLLELACLVCTGVPCPPIDLQN